MEQQNPKTIRCIVKLGGAAITCKNELETINKENLMVVSSQLRQTMMSGSASPEVVGMDWSKRLGLSEPPSVVSDFSDQPVVGSKSFVIVHGAGSFGHFQASKSGVHKGGLIKPLVKAGFVATRISVTSLNLEVVRALAREGIPSIGMSPFSCGWSTRQRNMEEETDVSMVISAIDAGFVPVLHGDAVLDSSQECTILSGDVIIRHLAAKLKPEYVVFLTDVNGVYDCPPTDPNAVLLREIAVCEDGSWCVVKPALLGTSKPEFTVASHDTTGGMVTKISEAAMIAKMGIDVYIVKAGTDHSLCAMDGSLRGKIPDTWLGTAIRLVR